MSCALYLAQQGSPQSALPNLWVYRTLPALLCAGRNCVGSRSEHLLICPWAFANAVRAIPDKPFPSSYPFLHGTFCD